ncbi:hypothetical protein HKBW3S42_01028, partial [Candidatus Hakubella thermalkaliphila]
MSKKELLLSEIEQVPEPFLDEILDFVHFLSHKVHQTLTPLGDIKKDHQTLTLEVSPPWGRLILIWLSQRCKSVNAGWTV